MEAQGKHHDAIHQKECANIKYEFKIIGEKDD